MKRQSRLFSFIESITNVLLGYSIAVVSQIIIFSFYKEIEIDIEDNLLIGIWFTFFSILRSFLVRRFFNNLKF